MHTRLRHVVVAIGVVSASFELATGPVAAAAPPGVDWAKFHSDDKNSGVTTETALNSSTASLLSIQWQKNMGNATNTSPAIVYNATLDKVVVYQGNKTGTMTAVDAGTGETIWSFDTPASVSSSPAVVGNTVYFGSDDHHLYAVNATTGAMQCRFNTGGIVNASPVVADPDTAPGGTTVYVGDNGFGGGNDGGHIWALYGVNADTNPDCGLRWSYDQFGDPPGSHGEAGSWSPPAFARDANGRALIVVGSSSSDNAVYAFDAVTGSRVWRFETEFFFLDGDVGAGITVSPPGTNGFADGVAYVAGKNKILYALNLTTGSKLWEFSVRTDWTTDGGMRSTPALAGDRLYFGGGLGVYALNAKTGAKIWRKDLGMEVVSSAAVSGAPGEEVVFTASLSGHITALRAQDGSELWSYQAGDYIYGSPAVAYGRMYIGSGDGFLYSFGVGGGVSQKPLASISEPEDNATLPNPNGSVTIAGDASDDHGVVAVLVAVKSRNTNKWWNGTTLTWTKTFAQNEAAMAAPGATATEWETEFPASPKGDSYVVYAEAVDGDRQHTAPVAIRRFTIESTGNPPDTAITSPTRKQVFNFKPGSQESFPITISGVASDAGGENRGVHEVVVVIKNIEHVEYYCGAPGCATGAGESAEWTPRFTKLLATLDRPGANSTNWTITFPVYDHPHRYSITAWAVDRDGERDPTKAKVSPICIRDAAISSCI